MIRRGQSSEGAPGARIPLAWSLIGSLLLGGALLWAFAERSQRRRLEQQVERLSRSASSAAAAPTAPPIVSAPESTSPVKTAPPDAGPKKPPPEPPPGPEAMLALFHSADPDELKRAHRLLDKMKDRSAYVDSIRYLLSSEAAGGPAAWMRWDAMDWLAELKGPEAAALALQKLQDPSPSMRRYAAYALGSIGEPSAAPALQEAYEGGDIEMKGQVARSLRRLGDDRFTERLLSDAARCMGDPDGAVRELALEELARLEAPAIVPVAAAALSDPNSRVRREAARTLGRAKDPAALPYLDQLMADPDERVRNEARRSIERIGVAKP